MATVPNTARPTRQGQTDHLTLTVANRADPVKRSFNSRPVVATELTEPGHHSLQILARQGRGTQRQDTAWITRFWNPT